MYHYDYDALEQKLTALFGQPPAEPEPGPDPAKLRQIRLKREEANRILQLEASSIAVFLKDSGRILWDKAACVSTRELYEHYQKWCGEQGIFPRSLRSLGLHLKQNATVYDIRPTAKLRTPQGTYCRGYRGIGLRDTDGTDHEK